MEGNTISFLINTELATPSVFIRNIEYNMSSCLPYHNYSLRRQVACLFHFLHVNGNAMFGNLIEKLSLDLCYSSQTAASQSAKQQQQKKQSLQQKTSKAYKGKTQGYWG